MEHAESTKVRRQKGEEKGSRGRVGRSREAKESKWPGRNGDQRRRGNTGRGEKAELSSLSLSLSRLSRGLRGELLFDSGRTVAENTNGRIMKMVPCDAAATLARSR